MKLYKKYLALHLKCELEYKLSFIMSFITQGVVFFASYFVILSLFSKFKNLQGYTVYEILLVYGVIQFGFSLNEVFNRGFDHFDRLIKNGELDRLLLRPRNIFLQIFGYDIDYTRLSRLFQSIIILIIAIVKLNINWNINKILTLVFMLISSPIIFFVIYLVGAAFCFITVEGLETKNIFTDGGREMAQYPMNIYTKPFQIFFTYIIPFSLINYYPLKYILGTSNNPLYIYAPLVILIYIIPAVLIFNRGLKRYTSTGS